MAILRISAFSSSVSILKPPSATTPSPSPSPASVASALLPPASFHARIWRPSSLSARSRAVDWATPGLISSRSASKVDGKVSTFVDLTTYTVPEKSIHEFTVKDIDGNIVELSLYKGKVLLVVNVASQCSLTIQNYKELVQLYRGYQDQGLEILAFPCNQFGKQEPAISATIKSFAKTKFHVEFPLFNKVNVNGPYSAPLYKFLRIMKGDTFPGDQIKWNFAKFLVDKAGLPVARYVPVCSPLQIEDDIRKLLGLS